MSDRETAYALYIDPPLGRIGMTEAEARRAGFDVLRVDYAADHLHVGFVCRPGTATDAVTPAGEVAALFSELRFVQNAPRNA